MRYYKIASWILLITGIGDVICTDLFRNIFLKIENQTNLYISMVNTDVSFLGLHRNMLSIYNGFSLSAGILLIFVGALNLLFINSDTNFKSIRNIIITNIVLCIFFIFICCIFLPVHGVFIASIVLVFFIIAYTKYRKTELPLKPINENGRK